MIMISLTKITLSQTTKKGHPIAVNDHEAEKTLSYFLFLDEHRSTYLLIRLLNACFHPWN